MGSRSRHLSIDIDRPVADVYAYAADPRNLPSWAAGLAGADLAYDDGHWVSESPMGRVTFTFAPPNDFGVLDHDVTLPTGETVRNPLRVIGDGEGTEVVFTLRQRPEMTDADFERDADAVTRDLATLKAALESD